MHAGFLRMLLPAGEIPEGGSMMGNGAESLFYGLISLAVAAALFALMCAVKAGIRRLLRKLRGRSSEEREDRTDDQ